MLKEPPDWQMVRARIATFPPARHMGFAKTSRWIGFQKSARRRSEADNRGALLAETLYCAVTQLVGIALAFLCEPNDELRNRRCHSSRVVNDAALAQRGFVCRRQRWNVLWFEYGPVFGFNHRPDRHVQPLERPPPRERQQIRLSLGQQLLWECTFYAGVGRAEPRRLG